MPKPPADPIADQNREWLRQMADPTYAKWWRQRMRDLIERCEFPERKAELRILLKEVEARDGDGLRETN